MLFSTVNLIDPATAIRAARQMATAVLGASTQSANRVDREHILQALSLACLDLDQADPLLLPVTVDTTTWRGRDSPAIPGVGNGFIGTQLDALYMPAALLPENLIPFALTAVGTIIPQAIITADLLALIRFPRRPAAVVISTLNGRLFSVNNIGAGNVALSGSGMGPALDGVTPDNYGFCLLIAQSNPAQNGVYAFSTNGATYTFTRPGSVDCDWAHQGAAFVILGGNTYGGKYVQLTTPDPITIGTTATSYQTLASYMSNIDAAECDSYIVPRAAAYIVQEAAVNSVDKNSAANLTAWADLILARPLPIAGEAHSRRIQTVTRYANV